MKSLKKILLTTAFLVGLNTNVFSRDPFILDKYIVESYTIRFRDEIITFEDRISPPGWHEVVNPNLRDYHIIVKKPGKTIRYMDLRWMDLKIEQIKITKNNNSKRYYKNNSLDAFIFDKAQEQFDFYLKLIEQAKVNDILGN